MDQGPLMSRDFERDEIEKREAAWARKAEYMGWRCWCGEIPLLGEAEVFFETGLCGYHAAVMQREADR